MSSVTWATYATKTRPILPMKYDAFCMGTPCRRLSVPSSRSIGIAIARFWNDV